MIRLTLIVSIVLALTACGPKQQSEKSDIERRLDEIEKEQYRLTRSTDIKIPAAAVTGTECLVLNDGTIKCQGQLDIPINELVLKILEHDGLEIKDKPAKDASWELNDKSVAMIVAGPSTLAATGTGQIIAIPARPK